MIISQNNGLDNFNEMIISSRNNVNNVFSNNSCKINLKDFFDLKAPLKFNVNY